MLILFRKLSLNRNKTWYLIFLLFCFLFSTTFFSIVCFPNGKKESIQSHLVPTKFGNMYSLSNRCTKKSKLLVFIHGSPGEGSDFTLYLEDESLQKRNCIVSPDRLGFGKSFQKPFQANLKLQSASLAEMIQTFIKRNDLDFQEITILGHSYGGPVAFGVGLILQGQSKANLKVVLLSAPMDPKWERLKFYNHLANHSFVQWMLPDSWIRSNEEMFPLQSELEVLRDDVKVANIPVIIIHGESDGIVPIEHKNYLPDLSYQGKLKTYTINDGSHFIPWTRFKEIKTIILNEESL
ncbi:alpha/beta hydrolase [Leptospira jelokensis]|uniref:Alpha/beta hydrolase n=2 Tax=Leptospira jelokensis TaxID=2484931 RepID=A0A4Z1A2F5_9LEPT|nr:alpha/beta hydrolase [Leptospira jelokensis]